MIFRLFFVWLISSAIIVLCSIPDSNIEFDEIGFWKLAPDGENNKTKKLNMTVYYESLCPDCVDFFKEQFSKNWKPFFDYLNVTLVPYGKASQKKDKKGNWTFECQHGEEECYHNRIQACAINRMHKLRPKRLLNFTSCYMSHKDKDKYGPKCAKPNNIAFKRLKRCAKGQEGHELLAKMGNLTHDFDPNMSWVPTVVFNNKYNNTENNLAASNLKSILCQKLDNKPNVCK